VGGFPFPVREVIFTGCPVVSWAYIPAAEMPIPAGRGSVADVELRSVQELPEHLGDLVAPIPGPLSVIDSGSGPRPALR